MIGMADVAVAAKDTLQTYLPGVLDRLYRVLAPPGTYEQRLVADDLLRVKGTALAVSCSGLTEQPEERPETVSAWFALSVAVFHQDSPAAPLLTAGGDYAKAVAVCLLENRGLGIEADELVWRGWDWMPYGDAMSTGVLGMATVDFAVLVEDVFRPDPPRPGGPDVTGPVVLTTDVTFTDPI